MRQRSEAESMRKAVVSGGAAAEEWYRRERVYSVRERGWVGVI